VIGDLMAALDDCAQRLRVEFADSSRRKDRCLDAVCIEQLDEPPARRIQLGRNTLRVSADPIAKPAAALTRADASRLAEERQKKSSGCGDRGIPPAEPLRYRRPPVHSRGP